MIFTSAQSIIRTRVLLIMDLVFRSPRCNGGIGMHVCFSDFNSEVIEQTTVLNVRLNVPQECWDNAEYYCGDWGSLSPLLEQVRRIDATSFIRTSWGLSRLSFLALAFFTLPPLIEPVVIGPFSRHAHCIE